MYTCLGDRYLTLSEKNERIFFSYSFTVGHSSLQIFVCDLEVTIHFWFYSSLQPRNQSKGVPLFVTYLLHDKGSSYTKL